MKPIFSFFSLLFCLFFSQALIAQNEPIKKRILIGSTVRQHPKVLKEFCDSLDRLEKTPHILDYCFIDDNSSLESSEILAAFAEQHQHQCILLCPLIDPKNSPSTEDHRYTWDSQTIWQVASLKNKILNIARENDYDYLFLVDSDLVLHPKTLKQLLSANKEIVSNIFWTSSEPNTIEMPQVWVQDQYKPSGLSPKEAIHQASTVFFKQLKTPGLYEVGGLGTCTLISRDAIRQGVSFKKITNISFLGEDCHFCIRAAALGIPLFVDTHYPAYHISHLDNLPGVENFKRKQKPTLSIQNTSKPRLTLSMIVKNEADKHLKEVLLAAREYITDAVIIDDASTDDTVAVCREILADIPLTLILNDHSKFSCEYSLREQQWNEVVKTNPDWIICLDADEIFEKKFADEVEQMIANPDVDAYYFRLYDFWDPEHYREDLYWKAHFTYRPFLIKYNPNVQHTFHQTVQHCGRFPIEIRDYSRIALSELRLKHYGWIDEQTRISKYLRYHELDPDAASNGHYQSILDPSPYLVTWEE